MSPFCCCHKKTTKWEKIFVTKTCKLVFPLSRKGMIKCLGAYSLHRRDKRRLIPLFTSVIATVRLARQYHLFGHLFTWQQLWRQAILYMAMWQYCSNTFWHDCCARGNKSDHLWGYWAVEVALPWLSTGKQGCTGSHDAQCSWCLQVFPNSQATCKLGGDQRSQFWPKILLMVLYL